MSIQTGMKMYNSQLSPFAARCRLAIYAKDLDVEFLDMPDPALEAAFSRLAPMHTVHLLVDGETVLPASATISEVSEDRVLRAELPPADPVTRHRLRRPSAPAAL